MLDTPSSLLAKVLQKVFEIVSWRPAKGFGVRGDHVETDYQRDYKTKWNQRGADD